MFALQLNLLSTRSVCLFVIDVKTSHFLVFGAPFIF
jgi:hypothetical protein